MTESIESSSKSSPRRLRTVIRVLVGISLGLALLVAGTWKYLTGSSYIISKVTPQLEAKLGGDVSIQKAAYLGEGRIELRNFTLKAPDQSGMAAEILSIGRTVIIVDETLLSNGEVLIKDIELDNVVFRISESATMPGVFNYHSLTPDWSLDDETEIAPALPHVKINSAVVELGMHVRDAYTQVGKRHVAGYMIPLLDEEATYAFELQELDETNKYLGSDGLVIKGKWNVQTLSHSARIDGLELDERAFAMCPLMARIWCEKMGLEGRVEYATIQRGDDGIMTVELNVEDVGMTLPLSPKDFWARIRNGRIERIVTKPRMRVKSGQIKLHGDRLTFRNLTGHIGGEDESHHLVSVPYRIELTTEELPTLQWKEKEKWLENVISSAPFHMRIWTDEFILPDPEDGVEPAVDLPYQIASLMARFELKGWGMSTEIDISREPSTFDSNGDVQASPILTKGNATITQASGAYHKFPYALDGINGLLEFDNEKVTIVEMNGRGSDGAQVSISGTISPPGKDAAVTLNLTAINVPLDSRFRAALKGHERTTFDSMLHQPSYDALAEAGSLVDEHTIKRADRELIEAQFALDEIINSGSTKSTDESAEVLRKKISRLQELIAAGPFKLGGLVDLDLMIQRPLGEDKRSTVTGNVLVHSAGVLYSRFPYPISVNQSTIVIERDRVSMGDGLKITTAGFGEGLVTGEVMLGSGDRDKRTRPNLHISVQGDELNELLFAAIPEIELLDSPKELSINPGHKSNSVAGRILQALGITGQINYSGTVSANEQGIDEFDFTVQLVDGGAAPGDDLVEVLKESGMLWPPGFSLENVRGEFQVTSSAIRINNVTGTRGDGRITVDGIIGIGKKSNETDINARFENLAVEQYLVNLLPGEGDTKVAELWDRYQPHGTYDAQLRYVAIDGEKPQPHLVVQPKELGIVVNNEDIDLICEKGELGLVDGKVVFKDLAIRLKTSDRDDGLITLEGSYGITEPDQPLKLHGKWSDGRLETALIAEIMDLIGAKAPAKRYISYKPSGTFSADFNYQSPVGKEPASFLCAIKPQDVKFVLNETQLVVTLEEESKVTFLPDRVILENIAGSHDAGSFRIAGSFEIGGPVVADLELEYLGWINRPELFEFLPEAIRSTFKDLSIDATEQVHLKNGVLHIKETRFDDGVKSVWDTRFDGLVLMRGGKIKAGVELSGIDGVLDFHVVKQPNLPLQMNLDVALSQAIIMGREISDVKALVVISDDGKQVLVKDLRADLCGGLVTAQVAVDIKPGSNFEYFVEVAGVDLSLLAVSSDEDSALPTGSLPSGDLYGSISVAGDGNDKSTRRGRGAMRIVDARLASMPLGLMLIQILQFMPPVNESLDYADSKFFITGDRVVFERLSLECSTLQLLGEGEMDFDTFQLNLRFRPRGTFEPLRDIIGGINDQLMAIKVTGTLSDPISTIIALPGLSSKGPTRPKKDPKVANVMGHAN
ncbi:MAG: hypothetical protein IH984_09755 [Planctomycetes bacterium]|nr:hypothetical protein [Planctomycetota bacterium]